MMDTTTQSTPEDLEIFDPSKPPSWRAASPSHAAPQAPSGETEIYTPGQRPTWAQPIPKPPVVTNAPSEESADPLERKLAQIRAGRDPLAGMASGSVAVERALNTALFNIPRHIETTWRTATNQGLTPFSAEGRQAYVKNLENLKALEEARAAQHPIAQYLGTGAGLVGSLALPMGWAARAAQAGKIGAAAVGAGLGGVSGYLEQLSPEDAATGAGLGAVGGVVARPLAGVLGRVASNIAPMIGRGAVDASGELTPKAMEVIRKAVPDMPVEAIQAMAPQFASVMQTKGINPAAAREAILQSQGAPLSRQMATGIRAPGAAENIAQESTEAARQAIQNRAEALAGGTPSPQAVAQMLQESQTAAHTAASQQYGRAFAHPGEFAPSVGTGILPSVERTLQSGANLPRLDEIRISPNLPQANAALNHLQQRFTPGVVSGPIDMSAMERTRQALNDMRRSAQGADKQIMQNIVQGFDNHLVNSLDSALFSGNGQQALADMRSARRMWADLQGTYYSSADHADQAVRNALKNFQVNQKWENGRLVPDLDPATAQSAQGVLNGNLISKPFGTALYNKLQGIIGTTPERAEALNAHIRDRALFGGAGEGLNKIARNINNFLDPRGPNSQLASKVFNPDQINQLRQLSQAIKIIERTPATERDPNVVSRTYSFLKSLVIPVATGFIHSPIGGVVAYAAQQPYQAGREIIQQIGARSAERAGAPGIRSYIPTQALIPFAESVPPAYSSFEEMLGGSQPNQPGQPRPQRAAGGKVNEGDIHERLVGRLMDLADKAKKTTQKSTEGLLEAPDEAIVHALKVADNVI